MVITVRVECIPIFAKELPDWDGLSGEVLKRLMPIGALFGVMPQGVDISAELSKEEEEFYDDSKPAEQ